MGLFIRVKRLDMNKQKLKIAILEFFHQKQYLRNLLKLYSVLWFSQAIHF